MRHSIEEAWAYPDGSIQAFVTDEGRELAVEIGQDINIFQVGENASFSASFAAAKERKCIKGHPCGGSCIAKGKTCSKPLSRSQKDNLAELKRIDRAGGKVKKEIEAKRQAIDDAPELKRIDRAGEKVKKEIEAKRKAAAKDRTTTSNV